MLPVVLTAALVADDQTFLRAAPDEKAPHPVILWKGDWLEVRGEARGYLSVYDHRHERAGYVSPDRVRQYPLAPESAPKLRAVLEFLRDGEDEESLGIAVAALYLRTAPPEAIDAGVFDAIGTMAERLAARVSTKTGRASPGTAEALAIASRLEVASSYGLVFRAAEQGEKTRIHYDGEAFRRVLALGGTPLERARAVLFLTDPKNVDPALGALDQQALTAWQAGLFDGLDAASLPPLVANRVRIRHAATAARLAYVHARKGEGEPARAAGERAIAELARVDRTELRSADVRAYDEAAVLVAAERWAVEGDALPKAAARAKVELARRDGGETCVTLSKGTAAASERCTHGVLRAASLTVAPSGDRVAVAVEPVAGWVELWLWSKTAEGWRADTIVPGLGGLELGYVEHAGWLPDGRRFLAAREVIEGGALRRELQVIDAETLEVEKRAPAGPQLPSFMRQATPAWRAGTLALR